MLYELRSNLPGFKSATFTPGVNVVLAIRTRAAATKDSRNAVGKSSFIKVLDFLLGSELRAPHVLRNTALEGSAYSLALDLDGSAVTALRRVDEAKNVEISDTHGSMVVPNTEWKSRLGEGLFQLTGRQVNLHSGPCSHTICATSLAAGFQVNQPRPFASNGL